MVYPLAAALRSIRGVSRYRRFRRVEEFGIALDAKTVVIERVPRVTPSLKV